MPQIGVSTTPGSITATLTPNGFISMASDSLSADSANFVAAYAPWPGSVIRPIIEVTLTITPRRRVRIDGSTACIMRTAPNTLVSNIVRISASGISSTGAADPMPALLTSTSTGPSHVDRHAHRFVAVDVERDRNDAAILRPTARCRPSDDAGVRAPA